MLADIGNFNGTAESHRGASKPFVGVTDFEHLTSVNPGGHSQGPTVTPGRYSQGNFAEPVASPAKKCPTSKQISKF